jgi:hypothetical protein
LFPNLPPRATHWIGQPRPHKNQHYPGSLLLVLCNAVIVHHNCSWTSRCFILAVLLRAFIVAISFLKFFSSCSIFTLWASACFLASLFASLSFFWRLPHV